ncbi:hypothetical protein ACFWWB_39305 [Streptomyces sp. NPDC058690]|uniref:hypothetical protein n=1 Tax=Streptomyces sp. NPDC058690 TaxID=3346600 RepID=UPI00364AE88D
MRSQRGRAAAFDARAGPMLRVNDVAWTAVREPESGAAGSARNISTMAVLSAPKPYDRTVGRLGNVAGVAEAVRAGC